MSLAKLARNQNLSLRIVSWRYKERYTGSFAEDVEVHLNATDLRSKSEVSSKMLIYKPTQVFVI